MESLRITVSNEFFLSRIGRADKAALLEHLADPEIAWNTLAIPFPYTEADADWWIDRCENDAREPEKRFAIRESTGRLIGVIGIDGDLSADAFRAEFGYWLARSYRGKGIMTQVIRVFASHAFQELGLHRLYATPFVPNLASQRALEKAGFQREGLLRHHWRKDGVYLDAFIYGRIATDDC